MINAVTQEGLIRTIARKGTPGQPIEGAVIRVRGSHNAVQSHEQGDFSLLLHNLQNGEPFAISSVIKSGYEPAEQEIIGRKLPCSEFVPMEILMVSIAQLQQDKEAIAAKARENVELFYEARLVELESALAAKRLSEAEFANRLQQLESQYERFEPLLQSMSDKLARTDYSKMDSLSYLIQQAIENGNPEEAERLVRQKGDLEQREAAIREQEEQIAKAQQIIDQAVAQLEQTKALTTQHKRELADDYYRMYSSFLARFINDSAYYYIAKRAALDTLNIDYQLQAGQFAKEIMADYKTADIYLQRALRIARSQYDEQSGQMATVCNELGTLAKAQRQYEQALLWYQQSLAIRENLFDKHHPAIAEALNNLGELYRVQKQFKQAMNCHSRALKIREKAFGINSLEVAESKNNLAGVHYMQAHWEQARELFTEVQTIYSTLPETPLRLQANNANNLGGVAYQLGQYSEAAIAFQLAVDIYTKVLGANHPLTKNAKRNQAFCNQKSKQL